MAKIVPDFRNASGEWAGYFSVAGLKCVTRLRKVYEHMLERCEIGGTFQKAYPTYVGCSSEFASFQSFASWAINQTGYALPGAHLDKDLLYKGNKTYSEDTCVFIPQSLNKLLLKSDAKRKDLPIGVSWDSARGVYKAQMGGASGRGFIGRFPDPDSAFAAYKQAKEEHIAEQAELYRAVIDPRVYRALLAYQVEVTD